jgi:hypothetical protein
MEPFALIVLYLLFRLKHFACDFLFQTDWMALMKGKPGKEGYRALFTHTAIHALGTLIVTVIFAPALWWLGVVDFVVHSIIDRVKGVFTYSKGWTPKDTVFWWTLGADQEAHNLTHLVYVIVIWMHLGGTL